MSNPLNVVLEALRRTQAKISFYSEPGNRNDRKALGEIAAIVEDKDVVEAMRLLRRPDQAPSVAPTGVLKAEARLHKALPGS